MSEKSKEVEGDNFNSIGKTINKNIKITEYGFNGDNTIFRLTLNENTENIISIEKRLASNIWDYHTGANPLEKVTDDAGCATYSIQVSKIIDCLDENEIEVFDFYQVSKSNSKKQIMLDMISIKSLDIEIDQNRKFNFSFYKNASGCLSLTVKNLSIHKASDNINQKQKDVSRQKIKLAVIGSCFSRQAFRSDKIYNPDYKKFYEVGLTFYHMSIPSMVSDPIEFDEKDFVNSENQKDLLKYGFDSFKKDCFDKIKDYNPDYVIIENYPSITNNLYEIDGAKYIDNNYYLKNTDAIKKIKNKRLISNCSKEFFEIFKKSVDKFKQKIESVIDLSKVILIRSQPALKKKEGDKTSDWDSQQVILMRRYLWNKFDNYFVSNVPRIKIIDLRDEKYISEKIEGMAFQSNHLSQQYYKDEFNEFNKIVLYDLINKKR